MCSDVIIQVENLSKTYHLYRSPVERLLQILLKRAPKNVTPVEALSPTSFTLRKGECVGIIGRNGSGKSTLLQMLCGTLTPSAGNCQVHGRVAALLELGAGFNPEFSGRENIYLNAALLGLSKPQIDAQYEAIVAFSGLSDKLDQLVKTYSSGMVVRLAFAVAVHVQPDILVIDEALAVGDERFQKKCYDRLRVMQAEGVTILFVSHAANTVTELCERALLLDNGELLFDGNSKSAVLYYRKLLYAPVEHMDAIRQEIKQSTPVPDDVAQPAYSVEEAHYVEGMQAESRLEYPSDDVAFADVALYTASGEKVNVLKHGEAYELCVTAKFMTAQHNVRCNYRIHSVTGVEVSGANSQPVDDRLKHVAAGEEVILRFAFNNLLLSGAYFITVNMLGAGADHLPPSLLKRINDALMFRVLPLSFVRYFGFAVLDTGVTCTIGNNVRSVQQ